MGPSGRFTHIYVILNCLGHVLFLGRAPRTKETLPVFRDQCRFTRRSRVFYGLTGSQRTPKIWGVTFIYPKSIPILPFLFFNNYIIYPSFIYITPNTIKYLLNCS